MSSEIEERDDNVSADDPVEQDAEESPSCEEPLNRNEEDSGSFEVAEEDMDEAFVEVDVDEEDLSENASTDDNGDEALLDPDNLDAILLALLFVSDNSVPIQRFVPVFETEANLIAPKNESERKLFEMRLIDEIAAGLQRIEQRLESDESPIQLVEIAGGYQLCTKPEMSPHIDRFFERRKRASLSGAALETLAIIAYQQPITRAELEAIRGVNVDYIVHSLLERRLIRVAGRKDAPGKPFMYRTTRFFLEYFGLGSLDDLPQVDELREAFTREVQDDEEAEQQMDEPPEMETPDTETSEPDNPSGADDAEEPDDVV